MRRRDHYVIAHADGRIERLSLPRWVTDPETLARRAPHSLVFYLVPRRHVIIDEGTREIIPGPAAMLEHDGKLYHVGPDGPRTDLEAFHLYRKVSHYWPDSVWVGTPADALAV